MEGDQRKGSSVLGFCGLLVVAAGMYFLFIHPGQETSFGPVMNLHSAVIGQTLMICGTILAAAHWRPR